MAYAPASVVDGPRRVPLPYGLFSVVSLAEQATERWESGVEWQALPCDPVAIVVGDCDSPEGFPKVFPETGLGTGEASAFTVYGTFLCNPIGMGLTRAGELAQDVLLAREQQAVEKRVWAAIAADPNVTTVTGGDPTIAIGNLEQFLAQEYGALGVIHAGTLAAVTLAKEGLIEAKGNQMQTVLGTPVIVGSGYPGTGTGGAVPAAGSQFIAATPAMFGYRSEVFVGSNRPGDLLNTAVNDLYGIAERNYLIGYDVCGVAFAPITLGE